MSNFVRFLDSHSRFAQNDSFTLSIFRSLGGSCKKWQPISRWKGGFHPPPESIRVNQTLLFCYNSIVIQTTLYTLSCRIIWLNLSSRIKLLIDCKMIDIYPEHLCSSILLSDLYAVFGTFHFKLASFLHSLCTAQYSLV